MKASIRRCQIQAPCSLGALLLCLAAAQMSAQTITTIAGGYIGDGAPGEQARLAQPSSVAVDAEGNMYIADTGHHLIRKVDALSGFISTVAGNGSQGFGGDGGPATSAMLSSPQSVALDGAGNLVSYNSVLPHRQRTRSPLPGYLPDGGVNLLENETRSYLLVKRTTDMY